MPIKNSSFRLYKNFENHFNVAMEKITVFMLENVNLRIVTTSNPYQNVYSNYGLFIPRGQNHCGTSTISKTRNECSLG